MSARTPTWLALTVACFVVGGATAPAVASEFVARSYSQDYLVAGAGVITVICPSPDRTPDNWFGCVPHDGDPGAPADEQIWFGGVGIDIPLDAVPVRVEVEDAVGKSVAGAVCVDHDMDNICGPADSAQDNGEERVLFFCGDTEVPADFDTDPMPGMVTRHIDVWVRVVGNLQHFIGTPEAPVCTGMHDDELRGIGTTGTVTVFTREPA